MENRIKTLEIKVRQLEGKIVGIHNFCKRSIELMRTRLDADANGNHDFYLTREWRQVRRRVLIRDDYTCQNCHKRKKQLVVHHVIPLHEDTALAFDLNNLITWCVKCHDKHHGRI